MHSRNPRNTQRETRKCINPNITTSLKTSKYTPKYGSIETQSTESLIRPGIERLLSDSSSFTIHEGSINNFNNNNHNNSNNNNYTEEGEEPKVHQKLNTLNGVTLPTTLNVLSILLFLRFGFIIGQMGILGTLGLLILSYTINLLTTMSVSAIATNGKVKGGGAYYMLSRSLGVEFGGGIGVIFYIGQILNSSMNVAGLVEPLMYNFNEFDGIIKPILIDGYWWRFSYCTLILFICVIVSLIGSSAVSNAGKYLCIMLIISIISIPISAILVKPFMTEYGIEYIGFSFDILKDNLLPRFTKGAAGSEIDNIETFNDMFGIFFPATAGILAGASMSGDLQNPSKSIPKGTLNGLMITFICYFVVIITMGCCIPRDLLYLDTEILQIINISPIIIVLGELSTSIFSIIVGIVGSAKLLQAIARDEILPGLSIFGRGDSKTDDPKEGIIITWLICQLFLFADLNKIATFITMAFLMTFIVTNLSCALLRIGSAPNFRPSFKYFSTNSALMGSIISIIAMFIVDGISAGIIIGLLGILIILIHFISPPKLWGDVSQSLIYHQVRKYLLKLRQDNVKYWRPQILLLVDDPITSWTLIRFCNNLKKGGLYVLGHVFLSNKLIEDIGIFTISKNKWMKILEISKVKGFYQTSISDNYRNGIINIFLGSGLGGMKPNISIMGFYDFNKYEGKYRGFINDEDIESLQEGYCRQMSEEEMNILKNGNFEEMEMESSMKKKRRNISICEWVGSIEDLIMLGSSVTIAKGFPRMEIPDMGEVGVIDLYPMEMIGGENNKKSINTSSNSSINSKSNMDIGIDTGTMILQMGAILHTVPRWKEHQVRVIVTVCSNSDEIIKHRHYELEKLLEILRMGDAKAVVVTQEEIASDVIRKHSNKSRLVITGLNRVEMGISLDERRCVEWVSGIARECRGLPPLLLVDAQAETLTTEL